MCGRHAAAGNGNGRSAVVVFTRRVDHGRWGEDVAGGSSSGSVTGTIARRLIAGLKARGEQGSGGGVDVLVFHDGGIPEAEYCGWGGAVVQLQQRGRTFGERLRDAVGRTLARGYERVVVVGTDTPHLRAGHVLEAVRRLESGGGVGLVLGEDTTGGCYLIGVTRKSAGLLEGVAWQAGTDFAALVGRGGEQTSVLREKLADVDDAAQLAGLQREGISAAVGRLLERLWVGCAETAGAGEYGGEDPVWAGTGLGSEPRSSRGPPAE